MQSNHTSDFAKILAVYYEEYIFVQLFSIVSRQGIYKDTNKQQTRNNVQTYKTKLMIPPTRNKSCINRNQENMHHSTTNDRQQLVCQNHIIIRSSNKMHSSHSVFNLQHASLSNIGLSTEVCSY